MALRYLTNIRKQITFCTHCTEFLNHRSYIIYIYRARGDQSHLHCGETAQNITVTEYIRGCHTVKAPRLRRYHKERIVSRSITRVKPCSIALVLGRVTFLSSRYVERTALQCVEFLIIQLFSSFAGRHVNAKLLYPLTSLNCVVS